MRLHQQHRKISIDCLNRCVLRPDLKEEIDAEYVMNSGSSFPIVGADCDLVADDDG